MIRCDFCALSPTQRENLLSNEELYSDVAGGTFVSEAREMAVLAKVK
jgi:hypothetical protein